MSQGSNRSFYLSETADVLQQLRVRRDTGLSRTEVLRRREEYGSNLIPTHKRRSIFFIFLDRFKDVLILFLLAAAAVSLAFGEVVDAVLISIAVFLDAILSFAQVWRTERTLARLREHVRHETTVRREGRLQKIPTEKIVVGDIIEVRAGEKVPADARLLTTNGLRMREGALTGESADVRKQPQALKSRTTIGNRINMLFMGTTIMSGTGVAVVTATGAQTEFGKIAQQLKESPKPPSVLRKKLQHSGMLIAWIVVGLVSLIGLVNVLRGNGLAESAHTAVTLVVSAIPEDLTIILTIALTVGVIRILKKKGVVRELSSAETLGAATVICTDKTGTLTEGEMTAREFRMLSNRVLERGVQPDSPWLKQGYIGFALASNAHRVSPTEREYIGPTTERTALQFVESAGLMQHELRSSWRMRDEISFNSEWKYRAVLVDHPTQASQFVFVSGAPEVLIERSSHAVVDGEQVQFTDELRRQWRDEINAAAEKGFRLLGISVRTHVELASITHDEVQGLTMVGILLISDPVRKTVPAAIAEVQGAGVQVKLVTGDYEATARAVAREVGILANNELTIDGSELQGMSDSELAKVVGRTSVFSRVEPLDKQRIVKALQSQGEIVSMTGDGVNDAVALNSANIGVAMGSGKDIAKDAADLILLDDNFATIVSAIREGRVLRDNVRKVIAFLLSTNAAEVGIFIVSLVAGLPLPLLPAQILWINLVTDGTSDVALSLEPEERTVMKRGPEDPKQNLLNIELLYHIGLTGIVFTLLALGMYWYLVQVNGTEFDYIRTMVFTFVAISSVISTWSFRSLVEPVWSRGFFQNKWLFVSASFSIGLQCAAIYTPQLQQFFKTVPLSVADWALLLSLSVVSFALIELRKFILPSPNGQAYRARPASV